MVTWSGYAADAGFAVIGISATDPARAAQRDILARRRIMLSPRDALRRSLSPAARRGPGGSILGRASSLPADDGRMQGVRIHAQGESGPLLAARGGMAQTAKWSSARRRPHPFQHDGALVRSTPTPGSPTGSVRTVNAAGSR